MSQLSLNVRIKFNGMDKNSKRLESLLYHAKPTPGKIQVVPTKKYATQRDLSLVYSLRVAEPCLEIAKDLNNCLQIYRKRESCSCNIKWYSSYRTW